MQKTCACVICVILIYCLFVFVHSVICKDYKKIGKPSNKCKDGDGEEGIIQCKHTEQPLTNINVTKTN